MNILVLDDLQYFVSGHCMRLLIFDLNCRHQLKQTLSGRSQINISYVFATNNEIFIT